MENSVHCSGFQLIAFAVLVLTVSHEAVATDYSITDIGTLFDPFGSVAFGTINSG